MSQDIFLTAAEVAKLLRVSEDTVYRMIADGTLDAVKVRGQWRIRKSSVDKYLGKK